jgi:hypothetical protein
MDRDEAIRLLTGGPDGVREWNEWRKRDEGKRDELIPDLSRADLSLARLIGADLTRADLRDADLTQALFGQTNLSGANLTGAVLRGAQFILVDLTEADLSGADLAGAELAGVRFSRSILRGTDFTGATILAGLGSEGFGRRPISYYTLFEDIDLSLSNGLDKVKHAAPSTISIQTFLLSNGKIPAAFLRGCGAPAKFIEYLPSLIGSMEPIQFYSCFISHSSKDQAFADRLHSRMMQDGLRVWYAPEDMRGGRKSIDQIDQAIRVYDKLLLVLSRASMASDWVLHEIRRAVEREKHEKRQVLFPIGLASWKDIKAWTAFDADMGKDLAKVVREYHIPAFSKWKDHDAFEAAFARLIEDLEAPASTGDGPGREGPPNRS